MQVSNDGSGLVTALWGLMDDLWVQKVEKDSLRKA